MEVFMSDGVRTARSRYGGESSEVRPDDLAALLLRDGAEGEDAHHGPAALCAGCRQGAATSPERM